VKAATKTATKTAKAAPAKTAKAAATTTKSAPVKAATKTATKTAKAAPAKTAKAAPAKTAKAAATTTTAAPVKAATKTAKAAPATKATPARATKATKAASATATPTATLRVATTEKPWTAKELREIREELDSERARAMADLEIAEHDLQGLMRDAGEGAGDDQADAGASIFGREYEMSLVANSRDKLDQVEHALERLANGTYGVCESCGNPIGKLRLQAAPRATLCMACKTRQEHR
jgi:RNA polymerase-binding protein DksA